MILKNKKKQKSLGIVINKTMIVHQLIKLVAMQNRKFTGFKLHLRS